MNDINLRKLQKVAPSKTTGSSGENDGKRKAGTSVIGLILRSLWGLYKIHETLWFYLVSL